MKRTAMLALIAFIAALLLATTATAQTTPQDDMLLIYCSQWCDSELYDGRCAYLPFFPVDVQP